MDAQLAIVTGTSSGIGAALAAALLEHGWWVVGIARRQVSFATPHYQHVAVDLGDLAALEQVARHELQPRICEDRWARVGLVNNAARIGAQRGIEATDPQQLAALLCVNTIAPTFLMGFVTRVTAPALPLRIVNLSSGAAVKGFPGVGDYGSSKAALRLAGQALAAELASPQRPGGRRPDAAILSYEPGIVDTAMQAQARKGSGADSPWNRPFQAFAEQGLLARPEDVVGEIVDFLASGSVDPFVERRYGT